MKCERCYKLEPIAICQQCKLNLCLDCLAEDLKQNQHFASAYYFCQQCEEEPATKFCYSCEQNLCSACNSKIHNKGKRAQHGIQQIESKKKFKVAYVVIVMADSKKQIEDSNQLLALLSEKVLQNQQSELAYQNIHLIVEGQHYSQFVSFSQNIVHSQMLTDQYLRQYTKYFPILERILMIDSTESRKLKNRLQVETTMIQSYEVENRQNISSSTENQSILKSKKPPIAYFQFYKLSKQDKRSQIELKMRKFAAEGILIVKKKQVEHIEGITRYFVRTIGDVEVEYCSLDISYLSIQSLIWVIRSIKEDMMTPGEKLILSRIKQSFDIKLHSKFWQSITTYIGSHKYQNQYDKGVFGFSLPKITMSQQGDQIILLLKGEEWVFEDQQKLDQNSEGWKDFIKFLLQYFEKHQNIPGGRYGCVQFAKMFGPESLKILSLGRLSLFVQEAINKGLIRYHKTLLIKNVIEDHKSFTNESSSFVEGEYSFSLSEKSLYLAQKQLKIRTIQSSLINILIQNQNQYCLSLAQIPLYLKKTIGFNFNLPELGFPKLKNLILTLNDRLKVEINKSTLSYSFYQNSEALLNQEKQNLREYAEEFLKSIVSIVKKIIKYFNMIVVDDLYNELNTKLGFQFEFRIYNAPDFCHFLYYYCSEFAHIQFISGVFMVYAKQNLCKNQILIDKKEKKQGYYKENPETSTPNFCNSFDSGVKGSNNKFPELFFFNNSEFQQKERKQDFGNAPEQNQLIQNLKFVQYLLNDDDDHKSHTTYKTVIENENIVNNLDWSISNLVTGPQFIVNKTTHIKALSEDFDIEKRQMTKQHFRVMSSIQQKEKHKE